MNAAGFASLLQGAALTVMLSLIGIVAGVPLGLALALVRWARIPLLSQVVAVYVSVLRATPLVTLALLIFFALPNIGIPVDPIPAAILTLSLNTAAFNCEIWRAALTDFAKPQIEAAKAAGMTPGLAFRRIVFPMTLLIKGSPAIAVLGAVDITRAAVRIGSETYEPLPPFIAATIIYFAIILVFVRAQRTIESYMTRRFGFA